MMDSLSVSQEISNLQPYIPGQSIEQLMRDTGLKPEQIIKLASNENPAGPSPLAITAAINSIHDAHRYPDNQNLVAAISQALNIGIDTITVGNGSNDILDLMARTFLRVADDESISSEYAFLVFQLITRIAGSKNVIVPAVNYGHDLAGISRAVTDHTKIIWIANPNNPTGTFIAYEKLESFVRSVPKGVMIVLDEAYYEYLPSELQTDSHLWPSRYPNVVIIRTFSKIYGLAGMRVGYAIASPLVTDLLNRVRQPFNVSVPALAAAEAAIGDIEFRESSAALNQAGMSQLVAGLKELNLSYIPSLANFVAVKFMNTQAVHEKLLKRGVIVRKLNNYSMDNYLRVSVGSTNEIEMFLRTLKDILISQT